MKKVAIRDACHIVLLENRGKHFSGIMMGNEVSERYPQIIIRKMGRGNTQGHFMNTMKQIVAECQSWLPLIPEVKKEVKEGLTWYWLDKKTEEYWLD